MDHTFCQYIIAGLAVAVAGVAGFAVKCLGWYRAEARARLRDTNKYVRLLKDLHDEM